MRHFCVLRPNLVLLCVAAGLSAQTPAIDPLIRSVQDHYNAAHTLTLDFTESYSLLGHRRPPETGTLSLRKVGKMRWDYTRPPGKLFISDGKTVYLYTASNNRVEKVSLKSTGDMRAPLAFLLGKLEMKKEFRDFTARPAAAGVWLAADARNDRLPYQSVQMLLDPAARVTELIVNGRDQSVLAYRFSNEKLNVPVAESAFRFVVPPGAQVVDALQQSGEQQ